jgi:membrane carboxypeptidase/penicillin-binding protein PbpC
LLELVWVKSANSTGSWPTYHFKRCSYYLISGGVKKSYWFVDDHFTGIFEPQDVLLWPARPGSFKVKVVDDKGLVDEVLLEVQMVQ